MVMTDQDCNKDNLVEIKQTELDCLTDVCKRITGMSYNASAVKEHSQSILTYLETFIANVPGSVYWKDLHGVYLGCNDYMAASIHLNSRYDIIGKTDYDLPWKDSADLLRANDCVVMETGIPLQLEETGFLGGGALATYLTRKVPLRGMDGKITGVFGTSLDITDRKKMEEALKQAKEKAEAADKIKTQFIQNVEHDLWTPVYGLAEMLKILGRNETDSGKKETLSLLSQASNKLLNLIGDILVFTFVESGELPVYAKPFSIKQVVRDVINLEMPAVKMKNIELLMDIVESVPNTVIGDGQRVQRILLNLVNNAIKFTHQGYVQISLAVTEQNESDVLLKLIVKDTGIGISEDQKQFIYDRFFRGTPTNQGLYMGLGLGLNIVEQFIKDLNGNIAVDSKKDEGTVFTCLLPFKLPFGNSDRICASMKEEETDLSESAHQISTKGMTKPCKILLVEDDQLIQKIVVTEWQNELNAEIDIAMTESEVLNFTLKNVYNLILMDIGLPGTDGYKVTQRIREQKEGQNVSTPIVALTAHETNEARKLALEAGMDGWLTKPLVFARDRHVLYSWIFPDRKHEQNGD
jgi:two-component system aerobic respiration control sensor histidine kinase ArcB